jgi:hypothetical protein
MIIKLPSIEISEVATLFLRAFWRLAARPLVLFLATVLLATALAGAIVYQSLFLPSLETIIIPSSTSFFDKAGLQKVLEIRKARQTIFDAAGQAPALNVFSEKK